MNALAAGLLMAASASMAQDAGQAGEHPSKLHETAEKAGEIATQPVRDIGIAETKIPPVLAAAAEAPYSLKDAGSCTGIAASIRRLNGALGADYSRSGASNENRTGKIAEAGGQAVINSLIPFRGLVREATGAAAAQRRLNAAIVAGFARRGFLHGLLVAKGCRTTI